MHSLKKNIPAIPEKQAPFDATQTTTVIKSLKDGVYNTLA